MKKLLTLLTVLLLSGCCSLTHQEQRQLRELKAKGITVERSQADWEAPASPLAAGLWGILPGGGNFYLAGGEGGDSSQYLYGFLNLLTWPLSVLWEIPQSVIDAGTINKRELIYYYTYEHNQTPAERPYGRY